VRSRPSRRTFRIVGARICFLETDLYELSLILSSDYWHSEQPRGRHHSPEEDALRTGIRVLDPWVELGRQFGLSECVQLGSAAVQGGSVDRHVLQLTALGRLALNLTSIHHAVVSTRTTGKTGKNTIYASSALGLTSPSLAFTGYDFDRRCYMHVDIIASISAVPSPPPKKVHVYNFSFLQLLTRMNEHVTGYFILIATRETVE